MTVPGVARNAGEGGLLGIAVSPTYARDRLVYAYLTSASDNRIVRFKLGGRVSVVLRGLATAGIHNGGRIAFGPDGKLYAGVGDAGNTANAQNAGSRNGKILRMNPDGSGARVWSLGHRNVQGLAWDRSRAAVGERVRPEHARRGQPDPAGAQLRVAARWRASGRRPAASSPTRR